MVINYFLNTKYLNSNFSVPNAVVDEFIVSADGNALKVLLTILRNTHEVPSVEQLALQLGISLESVNEALKFWSDNKVITIVDSSTKLSNFKNYKSELLQPSVILQLSEDDQNIKDILHMAEKIAGGVRLSQYEMSSLISAYNYLGMPKDVILALYSDCKFNNVNMKSFDSIISNWASLGVNSLDDANKYLNSETYGREVARIFKLQYLLPSQKDLVAYWNAQDFPIELVQYLYDKFSKTGDGKGGVSKKANIRYINAIVCDWIANGINTIEKAQSYENNRISKSGKVVKDTNDKPSYDLEEYISNLHKYY
jgi:DNA replication protein DnaD